MCLCMSKFDFEYQQNSIWQALHDIDVNSFLSTKIVSLSALYLDRNYNW